MKRLIFIIIFLFGVTQGYAQQKKLVLSLVSRGLMDTVRFLDNKRTILTTSKDLTQDWLTAQFWDTKTAKPLFKIDIAKMTEGKVLISDDEQYLIAYDYSRIECWKIWSQQLVWSKQPGHIENCDLSGNRLLVTAGRYHEPASPEIYNIINGNLVQTLPIRSKNLKSGIYINEGKAAAVEVYDNSYAKTGDTVNIYDLTNSQLKYSLTFKGQVSAMQYNTVNGLLTFVADSSLYCLRTERGDTVFRFHLNSPLLFTKIDHKNLVTVGDQEWLDGNTQQFQIRVWRLEGKPVVTDSLVIRYQPSDITFNSKGDVMSIVTADSIGFYDFNLHQISYGNFQKQSIFTRGVFLTDSSFVAGTYRGLLAYFRLPDFELTRAGYGLQIPMVKVRFCDNNTFITWNSHNLIHELEDAMDHFGGYEFPDIVKKWSVLSGKQDTFAFKGGVSYARPAVSTNGRYALTTTKKAATIWNSITGKKVSSFKLDSDYDYYHFTFNLIGHTVSFYNLSVERSLHLYYFEIRSIETGALVRRIKMIHPPHFMNISENNHYTLLHFDDSQMPGATKDAPYEWAQIIRNVDWKDVYHSDDLDIDPQYYIYNDGRTIFGPQGTTFFAYKRRALAPSCFQFLTHKELFHFDYKPDKDSLKLEDLILSRDGKLAVARTREVVYLWNGNNGKLIDTFDFKTPIDQYQLSSNGSLLLLTAWMNQKLVIATWDITRHSKIENVYSYESFGTPPNSAITSVSISPNNHYALISDASGMVVIYDLIAHKALYNLFAFYQTDSLVVDDKCRFDGTKEALSDIYYSCGREIRLLNECAETGLESELVSKIMSVNKSPIKAKELDQLQICNPSNQ